MSTIEIRRYAPLDEVTGLPTRSLSDELWSAAHPAHELFIQGQPEAFRLLERLPDRGFAIVGTRRPQQRSLGWVREVVNLLSGSELIILSGLALGIDACAHEAALDAGLPTIAFLGTGLNRFYPEANLSLRDRILDSGGLIVSEFPLDCGGEKNSFLRRNRLIAGWSKATWMVEAGDRSGAINTIHWARTLQRHCYVTPCFPGDPAFAGNAKFWTKTQYEAWTNAQVLWAVDSLFWTWPDLGSHLALYRSRVKRARGSEPSRLLACEVFRLYRQKGSASVEESLQWALEQGWSPLEFYSALQEAIDDRLIADSNGLLVSLG